MLVENTEFTVDSIRLNARSGRRTGVRTMKSNEYRVVFCYFRGYTYTGAI
jgi:hypothetical protein